MGDGGHVSSSLSGGASSSVGSGRSLPQWLLFEHITSCLFLVHTLLLLHGLSFVQVGSSGCFSLLIIAPPTRPLHRCLLEQNVPSGSSRLHGFFLEHMLSFVTENTDGFHFREGYGGGGGGGGGAGGGGGGGGGAGGRAKGLIGSISRVASVLIRSRTSVTHSEIQWCGITGISGSGGSTIIIIFGAIRFTGPQMVSMRALGSTPAHSSHDYLQSMRAAAYLVYPDT